MKITDGLSVYLLISVITSLFGFFLWINAMCNRNASAFVSPLAIYQITQMNIFGSVIVYLLYFAICPLFILFNFLFYILCQLFRFVMWLFTVGRQDEDNEDNDE